MLARAIVIIFAVMFSTPTSSENSPRRLALVIGNDAYKHVSRLTNAAYDAKSVQSAMRNLGYDILFKDSINIDYNAFVDLLSRFYNAVKPGDIAFFYFSGHGFQDNNNHQYMIPTDILKYHPDQIEDIKAESFSVVEVREQLRSRGTDFVVLIIDACRRDPFVNATVRLQRPSRAMRATFTMLGKKAELPSWRSSEYLQLNSTSPGQQALDKLNIHDDQKNSVFTRTLLKFLNRGRRPFAAIARDVGGAVKQATSGIDSDSVQVPSIDTNNMSEDFFLQPQYISLPGTQQEQARVTLTPSKSVAECDRLAAAPDDEDRPRSIRQGVHRELIDARAAIDACEAATGSYPNDPRLRFQLGRAYDANALKKEARESYGVAADAGYAAALTALGEMSFVEKEGWTPQADVAAAYFTRAMSRNARAQTFLGLMTIYRQTRPRFGQTDWDNFIYGLDLLKKADRRRDPEAAFWLGRLYHEKYIGKDQSLGTAETYYQKAEKAGHRRAILYLGNLYQDWPGDPKRKALMPQYWERAAGLGSGLATHKLANYYDKKLDRQRACELYKAGAELGRKDSWAIYESRCQ